MMQCVCGSDWFLEEKLVRPAGLAKLPTQQCVPMPRRDQPRYRYRCADCGLLYGEKPAEAEHKPQPKKRGRPPKAAQN